MMEQVIYWVGVVSILSTSLALTFFSLWLIFRALAKLLWKDLRKSYHLMQLNYFMNKLEQNGLAWCVDDMNKNKEPRS